MKCKFCGADVRIGHSCEYCGSYAEPSFYNIKSESAKKEVRLEPSGNYIVKRGDCLWSIAKKIYGSGSRYVEIMKNNKLKNAVIVEGQRLKL